MNAFEKELARRLESLKTEGLNRQLRCVNSAQGTHIEIDGSILLNFSSNDYLGLANHPVLKDAAHRAVNQYGSGAGASRLVCGSMRPHHDLEEGLAAFKGAEAALTYSSGYLAALGTICALVGREDVVVVDKLVHASIVDAVRLSRAQVRVFDHNDLDGLESHLKWANSWSETAHGFESGKTTRVLIITESIFSMDGDRAPLPEIVALKEKYGAWLMVDEAHATGLYGRLGRGIIEELELAESVEVQFGTLGKALGAAGGYICGSRQLIDYLVNRARTFLFSTAPVPAAAAAAQAALELFQSPEGQSRRNQLWGRVRQFHESLETRRSIRFSGESPGWPAKSPIAPIIIGDESQAVQIASNLRDQGLFVPAIRYPTVARGKARLRVTFSACHTEEEVGSLVSALTGLGSGANEPVIASKS